MISSSTDCRVLVVQNGARHDYAIPLALANHGLLSGFYTDACGNQGLGRLVSLFAALPKLNRRFALLKNRRLPGAVLPLSQSFPLSAMADDLIAAVTGTFSEGRMLGLSMAWEGLGDANMVYSSFGWSPCFLERARMHGARIVTEFYVRPSLWKVHNEEYRLYPDWEDLPPYSVDPDPTERLRRVTCALSDEVVAPTRTVKEDIVAEGLFPADRIHVVPYGIGEPFFRMKNRPEPGNVLFVGSCSLMKGIHYFAKATQLISLGQEANDLTFTAAGDVSDLVRHKPICSQIRFLGRIPRAEIRRLYEGADILIFPTLSDSFGAVILEAMAAGIPVICSPYCADIVEHGISGFVIEPRDTEALAHAILTLTQDRGLRERMAIAAKTKALNYTQEGYATNLIATLKAIHANSKETDR